MRPTFPAENSKFLSAIAENMNILLSTRKYPEQASGVHAHVSSAPVYTIETARQPSARLIGILQSEWANSQMRQKIKSYEPRKSNYASSEPHTVAVETHQILLHFHLKLVLLGLSRHLSRLLGNGHSTLLLRHVKRHLLLLVRLIQGHDGLRQLLLVLLGRDVDGALGLRLQHLLLCLVLMVQHLLLLVRLVHDNARSILLRLLDEVDAHGGVVSHAGPHAVGRRTVRRDAGVSRRQRRSVGRSG